MTSPIHSPRERLRPGLLLAGLAALTGACSSSEDSLDVTAAGLFADYVAEKQDDGRVEVRARLLVGGRTSDTNLDLGAGDTLEVRYGGLTRTMIERRGELGEVSYSQLMPAATDDSNEITVTFVRAAGIRLPSSARLPGAFSITAPADGAEFQTNQTLQITWDTAAGSEATQLTTDATCERNDGSSLDLIGTLRFDPARTSFSDFASGFLPGTGGFPTLTECDLLVEVDQESFGEVNVNFGEGGRFRAATSRSIGLRVLPTP